METGSGRSRPGLRPLDETGPAAAESAGSRSRSEFARTLLGLARSEPLARGDFRGFAALATEAVADSLGVERSGVWLFNGDRSVLRCRDLFEAGRVRHSEGIELRASDYPRYFAALERGRGVPADDAQRHPDTAEFTSLYLRPLGIESMLDAPIRREGRVAGALCCEHVGPRRHWGRDDQEFAASVADLLSLALEAEERRRAERAFRSAQEELLRQQWNARQQVEAELARTREDLVHQTRMATIGQVAANIAHELRNPLAAIQNAAYLLRRRLPAADAERWSEYVKVIEQEVGAADGIVSDLLEMSRAKQPIPEEVDLERLVREARGYVRESPELQLELDLAPRPFVLRADGGQLGQVLTNLIRNAAQATDGRGSVRVEARRDEGSDVIEVRDDGPGIPDELRERVFEPLYTTKAKGTGLGLAICRQIVERHGGTIVAIDAGAGGAAFRIRLPREAPAA